MRVHTSTFALTKIKNELNYEAARCPKRRQYVMSMSVDAGRPQGMPCSKRRRCRPPAVLSRGPVPSRRSSASRCWRHGSRYAASSSSFAATRHPAPFVLLALQEDSRNCRLVGGLRLLILLAGDEQGRQHAAVDFADAASPRLLVLEGEPLSPV